MQPSAKYIILDHNSLPIAGLGLEKGHGDSWL